MCIVSEDLNQFLGDNNSWRRHVYEMIEKVPEGSLATYGKIADLVGERTGRNPGARNVAWLRKRLYGYLGHDIDFPLHRIAKAGDVDSMADSDETKEKNDEKREREGSLRNPKWY